MSTTDNIETVKQGYATYATGDLDKIVSFFDDSVEWVSPGNSAISGVYRGKAELIDMIKKLATVSMTTSPKRFIADGDDVVVLTQVSASGQTGEEADVFTIRDGKIVKATIYGDTALMEKIFGTK